jgi:hypothetical protein
MTNTRRALVVAHVDRIRELIESCLHLDLPISKQLRRNLEAIKLNAEIVKAATTKTKTLEAIKVKAAILKAATTTTP